MFGLHFDHHTLSIARDGELLVSEPLAVEIAAKEPRFGRAALAAARGRPDLVSLNHWRELGRTDDAARSVAIEKSRIESAPCAVMVTVAGDSARWMTEAACSRSTHPSRRSRSSSVVGRSTRPRRASRSSKRLVPATFSVTR